MLIKISAQSWGPLKVKINDYKHPSCSSVCCALSIPRIPVMKRFPLPDAVVVKLLELHKLEHQKSLETVIEAEVPVVDVVDVDTMPTEIRNLVIPNPVNAKQQYANNVLHEIYSACAEVDRKLVSLQLLQVVKNPF